MDYSILGRTGIRVSRLCFGALTVGPLQAGLTATEGGQVIAYALSRGVNFIDTAQLYGTYPHIKEGMKASGIHPVIATKSYSYTREQMKAALEQALDELEVDYIDLFLLHEQESELTLAGHREALDYLVEQKEKGRVRATGLSTHKVRGARAGALHPQIEVIHPLINMQGLGINDGSRDDMLEAIKLAAERGKGIYAMKALGGGNLMGKAWEAFTWVNQLPVIHSLAVGMQTPAEVDVNLAWIEGRRLPETEAELSRKQRRLHIEDWCQGCGTCVEHCPQEALYLNGNRVAVKRDQCLFCGYCAPHCPEFCIKVV